MPMPKRNENASPKISTPIHTAVTGSRAPMMAEGVEPIRLIEIVMKKSESTVGRRANSDIHYGRIEGALFNGGFSSHIY